MVAKILKLAAVPIGLVASSYGIYAVSDREAKGDRVKPQQLSVYSVPPRESQFVEARPGRLQDAFSAVRTAVWPVVSWTRDACSGIRNGVEETIEFGRDSYVYLKKPPPDFLLRVGIISVSGLGGLILARKGSRLKKGMYPLGLTAVGVSICYPAQSVMFVKATSKKLYSAAHRTYDAVTSVGKSKPQKEEVIPVPSGESKETAGEGGGAAAAETSEEEQKPSTSPEDPAEANTTGGPAERPKDVKFRPPAALVDHGQSSPEDVDLYSTRT